MKISRSRLLFAALLAGFLSVISMVGAAPAPPARPGRPKVRLSFPADPERITSMLFSSDGKKLISCGTDGTANLWEAATGKHLATFTGNWKPANRKWKGTIFRVALSPDGKTLASIELDRSIRLWDVATGKKVATLTQPRGGIPTFLLFSRDGKSLLSLGRNNYLWDLETKKERLIPEGMYDENPITFLRVGAFDPKGKPLVLVRQNSPPTFELWTAGSNKEPAVTFEIPLYHEERSKGPRRLAFSPDCKTIASADGDFTLRLWDAATGKNTAGFPTLPGSPLSLAYSPDGKVLAVGYQPWPPRGERVDEEHPLPPPAVRLCEVATGKVLATLTGNPGPVEPLVFSPDGHTLATGDGGPNITLWSLPARYAPPK